VWLMHCCPRARIEAFVDGLNLGAAVEEGGVQMGRHLAVTSGEGEAIWLAIECITMSSSCSSP
jgi:hypothetical protein